MFLLFIVTIKKSFKGWVISLSWVPSKHCRIYLSMKRLHNYYSIREILKRKMLCFQETQWTQSLCNDLSDLLTNRWSWAYPAKQTNEYLTKRWDFRKQAAKREFIPHGLLALIVKYFLSWLCGYENRCIFHVRLFGHWVFSWGIRSKWSIRIKGILLEDDFFTRFVVANDLTSSFKLQQSEFLGNPLLIIY